MQISLSQWNDFLNEHPNAHVLQSGAWGELKSSFGWKAVRVANDNCGAQILFRSLPGGFTIGYIPKGPIGNSAELYDEIDEVCFEKKAIFLKIEPDLWEPAKLPFGAADDAWRIAQPVQPRRTVIVPLDGTEEEILGRMKQKTRYNIRLSEKKEVMVESSSDLDAFSRLMDATSERDGFGSHRKQYYQRVYDLFHQTGECELFMASYQGKPLAGLIVFARGEMSWYMYGASSDAERNRMPAYLIQWQAMKWAKERGCKYYDLWGIPDLDEDALEEHFTKKHSHDGLWGVYRFKRGFGGEVWRSIGAWDKVYNPALYHLYRLYMRLRGGRDE